MRAASLLLILTSLYYTTNVSAAGEIISFKKIKPSLYQQIKGKSKPDSLLFTKAYLGYIDLKLSGKIPENNHILSIVDFRISVNNKRLWVIDLKTKTILFYTYVAHGKGSGKEYAVHFSNNINSHKSSLGFYKTLTTYQGKNGLSLYLEGLEKGINDQAFVRHIVLHGAPYISPEYLAKNGSMGTSEGCPAVPLELFQQIIDTTKEGSCLFLFFPAVNYIEKSDYYFK